MMYISIFIFLLMLLLNSMFKIASFLWLGIPLLYALFVSILFPDFVQEQAGTKSVREKYQRLTALQPHHLPYHPVGHLDGTDQHQHIENKFSYIAPHHCNGAGAAIHHRR